MYGPSLGPADAERWVSLLSALLAGWVLYVNLGMLFEGLLLLVAGRRFTPDLAVATVAAALYLISIVSGAHAIVTGRLLWPLMFHASVIVLGGWSAWKWVGGASDKRPVDNRQQM